MAPCVSIRLRETDILICNESRAVLQELLTSLITNMLDGAMCIIRLRETSSLICNESRAVLQDLLTSLITFLLAVSVKFLPDVLLNVFRLRSSLAIRNTDEFYN